MAHEIENMFFVGEVPWHGLGQEIKGSPTSEDAIVAAGLDWEVGLKALVTDDGIPVGHRATYRKSDGKILGVVGPTWKPLQNKSAFNFFDPFVASGQAHYETAGSLQQGRRVWVLARLGGDDLEILKGDLVRKYLLLSNSHDGSLAIRVGFTPVRVVCANTLAAAHSAKDSKLIRITHQADPEKALAKVADVMNVVTARFEATAQQYRALAKAGCSDADLKRYVDQVFAPKRFEEREEMVAIVGEEEVEDLRSNVYPKVRRLFEEGRGAEVAGVRGTFWGAYNAVNEYIVHERGKDAGKRLESTWFGQGAAQNIRALRVGLEMAKMAKAA